MSLLVRLLILLCMLLCLTASAYGSGSITISGFVKDTKGEGIADVIIVLSHVDKNFTQETATNKDGFYKFDNLIRGKYDLLAEKKGFVRTLARNIKISAAPSFNILMKPQEPNKAFTDITVSETLDIVQAALQEEQYIVKERLDFTGQLETGWKNSEYTVFFGLRTGYRRKWYEAYVRSDGSLAQPKMFLNLDLRVQEHAPVDERFRDVPDVEQRTEEYFISAYSERLKILQRITDLILAKGGKTA